MHLKFHDDYLLLCSNKKSIFTWVIPLLKIKQFSLFHECLIRFNKPVFVCQVNKSLLRVMYQVNKPVYMYLRGIGSCNIFYGATQCSDGTFSAAEASACTSCLGQMRLEGHIKNHALL